jgi:hypothetical protein
MSLVVDAHQHFWKYGTYQTSCMDAPPYTVKMNSRRRRFSGERPTVERGPFEIPQFDLTLSPARDNINTADPRGTPWLDHRLYSSSAPSKNLSAVVTCVTD